MKRLLPLLACMLLLVSCEKEDETPLSEAPEGTEWKTVAIDNDEIGGNNLSVVSAHYEKSEVKKSSSQTIVSQKGTQLVFVLDENEELRGISYTFLDDSIYEVHTLNAASTVNSLFLLTPGLYSSTGEIDILINRLASIESYIKCLKHIRSELSDNSLTDILQNSDLITLFSETIEEYIETYITEDSKKKSTNNWSKLSVTKTPENKVEIMNNGMRYVDIYRSYIYNDELVSSNMIHRGMKGKTGASWGSIITASAYQPTIKIDNDYSPINQNIQTHYWVVGIGKAPYNEYPPDYINIDVTETYAKTILYYFVLPFMDLLVGGLDHIDDIDKISQIWTYTKEMKEVRDLIMAVNDGNSIAPEVIDLAFASTSVIVKTPSFYKLLGLSKLAAGSISLIIGLPSLAMSTFNTAFFINDVNKVPPYAKFNIGTRPDPPTLLLPTNGSSDQSTAINLKWNRNPVATSYRVEIAPSSSFKNPVLAANIGGYTSREITGLQTLTKYYWRTLCTSQNGISEWSDVWSFTTNSGISLPDVITNNISEFTQTSAIVGGNVVSSGGGSIIEKGIFWGTSSSPESTGVKKIINSSSSSFSASINGLTPNTPYHVKAYATNSQGTAFGNEIVFTTIGYKPVAEFSVSKRTITEGQSVQFTDMSSNNPTTWWWNFGDQETSELRNPTHTYKSPGSYKVTLFASNEFGHDSEMKAEYITVNPAGSAPVAEFSVSKRVAKEGEGIVFTDESTNDPTNWSWDFGDKSTSTAKNVTHVYQVPGTYTINLTVSNKYGSDNITKTNFITIEPAGIPPIAEFSASNQYVTEGGIVKFTDQTTNNPTIWNWDFGDGGSSTMQNPSYQYNLEGVYTVSLSTSNEYGSDTETKSNFILVNPAGSAPVAAFYATPTNIELGQSVQFFDQSTNSPTAWNWNFGDGQASHEQNPTHIYSSEGLYTVSLEVTNGFGSDIETSYDYITVSNSIQTSTVRDFDGNVYLTVKIGDQWWMAENLATTSYSDGTQLVYGGSVGSLFEDDTPYYFYYDNNINNKDIYGCLYTWPAVMNNNSTSNSNPSGVQGVCPSGWHVPSDQEWKELEIYIGMSEALADIFGSRGEHGGLLKEEGTHHWNAPNLGATNEYGFSALPAGYRGVSPATWYDLGNKALFSSSTDDSDRDRINYNYSRSISHDNTLIHRGTSMKYTPQSVRCIRD